MDFHIVTDLSQQQLNFIQKNPHSSFLNAPEWQKFQASLNRKTFIASIEEQGQIILLALIIKLDLPLNKSYFYSPHAPLIEDSLATDKKKELLSSYFKNIRSLAQKEKAIFYRLDPRIETSSKTGKELKEIFSNLSLAQARKEVQPQETLLLDLQKDEEALLKEMHSKTRYNIRLSKRKGVTIRQSQNPKDINIFYKIAIETKLRDQFGIHSKDYYQKQLQAFTQDNAASLFIAELKGQPLAANIVFFDQDTATYLHGASSNLQRNVMAPHLLQWAQIRAAQTRGLKTYDFWGITQSQDPKHPWQGITRFKKGFGGQEISYLGAFDFIISPFWYKIYNTFSK